MGGEVESECRCRCIALMFVYGDSYSCCDDHWWKSELLSRSGRRPTNPRLSIFVKVESASQKFVTRHKSSFQNSIESYDISTTSQIGALSSD